MCACVRGSCEEKEEVKLSDLLPHQELSRTVALWIGVSHVFNNFFTGEWTCQILKNNNKKNKEKQQLLLIEKVPSSVFIMV